MKTENAKLLANNFDQVEESVPGRKWDSHQIKHIYLKLYELYTQAGDIDRMKRARIKYLKSFKETDKDLKTAEVEQVAVQGLAYCSL